jgi:Cu/Ag efflux protein CusF
MKRKLSWILAVVFVLSSAVLLAAEKEGKVVKVDQDMKTIVVQGEKGDQWTLYYTETTKLKDGITYTTLKPGDKIEFEYTEKDGKMWVTEIEKEH